MVFRLLPKLMFVGNQFLINQFFFLPLRVIGVSNLFFCTYILSNGFRFACNYQHPRQLQFLSNNKFVQIIITSRFTSFFVVVILASVQFELFCQISQSIQFFLPCVYNFHPDTAGLVFVGKKKLIMRRTFIYFRCNIFSCNFTLCTLIDNYID